MSRELNLTPEEIGLRTGKDRSTVSNFIRLLQLPKKSSR
jgi:ParB family chromosome partitioning protein